MQEHCCYADLDYTHNGAQSEGHDSGSQHAETYNHSQRPQAYASGSMDGSQANGERPGVNGYVEAYNASLNGSDGPAVRQRGEGGRGYRHVTPATADVCADC